MRKILSNKWVHILLFLSIIVNAFMAGFIFSRESRSGFDRMDKKMHGTANLASLARYLPRDQRREFFHGLRDRKEDFRATKREIAGINRQIIDLLAADEIDQVRLEQLLTQERELHLKQISRFQQSLIGGLANLSPEQRRAILDEARRNFEKRWHDRPDWGHGPAGPDGPGGPGGPGGFDGPGGPGGPGGPEGPQPYGDDPPPPPPDQ